METALSIYVCVSVLLYCFKHCPFVLCVCVCCVCVCVCVLCVCVLYICVCVCVCLAEAVVFCGLCVPLSCRVGMCVFAHYLDCLSLEAVCLCECECECLCTYPDCVCVCVCGLCPGLTFCDGHAMFMGYLGAAHLMLARQHPHHIINTKQSLVDVDPTNTLLTLHYYYTDKLTNNEFTIHSFIRTTQ